MDQGVALVEAYLQINGYLTVAKYPVIESFGKQDYGVATDLDILAFRFPGAGRLVPGHGGKGMFDRAWPLGWGVAGLCMLSLLTLLVAGHLWSITFAFALWGDKILSALGGWLPGHTGIAVIQRPPCIAVCWPTQPH